MKRIFDFIRKTIVKRRYQKLLEEVIKRLGDPETEEIILRHVKKGDHPMWGKPGWRMSVKSEFIKTY